MNLSKGIQTYQIDPNGGLKEYRQVAFNYEQIAIVEFIPKQPDYIRLIMSSGQDYIVEYKLIKDYYAGNVRSSKSSS